MAAFQQDPSLILKADDFITIKQEDLLEFLTKKNVFLKQIEVWDKLMEWAIGNSNALPSDVTRWTNDNLTTFKTLIQPFISHIDFREISRVDFFKRIKPVKNIFDDKFYIKIIEDYCFDGIHKDLTSPSSLVDSIDSQIIDLKGALFIADWIKIMKQHKREITYDFNLLIRGTRDGFNSKTFHEYCDNKGPTLSIVRVKNSNEILGGFNPFNWKSIECVGIMDYDSTKESFIFSLDKNNLENSIFSKVVNFECAIRNGEHLGPFFGPGSSDFELLYKFKKGQCVKESYEKAIRQSEEFFDIDDYEVFQVNY